MTTSQRVRGMSGEHRYETFLNRTVDDIFDEAYRRGWTWVKLASESGMSYNTVSNLGNRITFLPQLRTIYRMAKSVGMNVELISRKARQLAPEEVEA
jgi:hypothetical protein